MRPSSVLGMSNNSNIDMEAKASTQASAGGHTWHFPLGEWGLADLGAPPTLEEAQQLVGGWVELVTVRVKDDTVQVLCNEEGRLAGLPVNEYASLVLGHPFVGPVVVLIGNHRWE